MNTSLSVAELWQLLLAPFSVSFSDDEWEDEDEDDFPGLEDDGGDEDKDDGDDAW